MEQFLYSLFKTKFGWMGIAGNDAGLIKIILPLATKEESVALLKRRVNKTNLVRDEDYFKPVKTSLINYFKGKRVVFDYPIDINSATNFEKKVWRVTQSIPYGEVRTYQFIAQAVGSPKAFRAVGQALKKNSLPIIIPCHRVIRSNGQLGGFSGGRDLKKNLLAIEGYKW